jgi:hypothetical protein
MLATAKTPGPLLSSFFGLLTSWPSARFRGRPPAKRNEPSLEEATALRPPHMLVDIGLASPPNSGVRTAPTSQPLVPPVAAMHRRGDWDGHALGRQHADEDLPPIPLTWTWPLRI